MSVISKIAKARLASKGLGGERRVQLPDYYSDAMAPEIAGPMSGDLISTRVPIRAGSPTGAELENRLIIGTQAVENAPVSARGNMLQANAMALNNVPGLRRSNERTPEGVLGQQMQGVVSNLLNLYDAVPDQVKGRTRQWYQGANRFVNEWSEKSGGLSPRAVAGAVAALSPQKDWFQNADLARRLIEFKETQSDQPFTAEMVRKMQEVIDNSQVPKGRPKPTKLGGVSPADMEKFVGVPMGELPMKERAIAARMWDELNNARDYPTVSPEGDMVGLATKKDGTPARVAWGSTGEIQKALSILNDDSIENISRELGNAHKVRNFYNNIIDPNDRLSITVDTHAVAAGLLQPLSGKSPEVGQALSGAFGAGASAPQGAVGTYGPMADAYRVAAEMRGIDPREMQSVTWEAVRGLFPDTLKNNKEFVGKINQLGQQVYNGQISPDEYWQSVRTVSEDYGGTVSPMWNSARESGMVTPEMLVKLAGASLAAGGAAMMSDDADAAAIPSVTQSIRATRDAGRAASEGRATMLGTDGRTFADIEDETVSRIYDDLRSQLPRTGEPVFDQAEPGDVPEITSRGAAPIARYGFPEEYAEVTSSVGKSSPDLIEINADDAGARAFAEAITGAKTANRYGASVYVYPEEEYKNMRLFLSDDGTAGYALKPDGDIVSAFSTGQNKGVANNLLLHGIEQGGKKLDAFDTVLPDLYSTMGFRESSRLAWDDEQAPDDWSKETFARYNAGEPDVSFMAYDDRPAIPVEKRMVDSYPEAVDRQSTDVARGRVAAGATGIAGLLGAAESSAMESTMSATDPLMAKEQIEAAGSAAGFDMLMSMMAGTGQAIYSGARGVYEAALGEGGAEGRAAAYEGGDWYTPGTQGAQQSAAAANEAIMGLLEELPLDAAADVYMGARDRSVNVFGERATDVAESLGIFGLMTGVPGARRARGAFEGLEIPEFRPPMRLPN